MSSPQAAATGPRYETILRLASGGMATVWIGTVRGALGFRQLVAIKKPHPHLLTDPGFRGELIAEARLASMIRHANVVDVRDVEIEGESISLIMDFIEGASLGELLVAAAKKSTRIPPRVAVRIVRDACAGLHAAHELVDERDRPVGLVHRDVSPQNVLVGTDGISRVTDFGVAKFSRKNMQSTSEGSLKGKLAYMAPEYVRGEAIDRRFDVFALGVVLWEALTGKRCFRGENEAETLKRLLDWVPDPVSKISPELEPLDSIIACALAKDRNERFQNAAAMGAALEGAASGASLMGSHTEVAAVLKELAGAAIEERRALVRAKLANEPSVASLMGHPPIAALNDALAHPPPTKQEGAIHAPAPDTKVEAGGASAGASTTAAATPKMGGGGAEVVASVTLTTGGATIGAASAVPSTQPMTAPPPHQGAPNGNVATLASAPPLANVAAPKVNTLASPQAQPMGPMLRETPPATLGSAGANTLRSEDPEGGHPHIADAMPMAPPAPAPMPMPQPNVAAFAADAPASAFPVTGPPTRSLAPLLIGGSVVLAGIGALIWFAHARTTAPRANDTAAATATASIASATPAASISATSTAASSPTPAASPSAAPVATAAKPTTRAPAPTAPARGKGTHPAPGPTTAPSTAPLPAPTPTTKNPPDNPYN